MFLHGHFKMLIASLVCLLLVTVGAQSNGSESTSLASNDATTTKSSPQQASGNVREKSPSKLLPDKVVAGASDLLPILDLSWLNPTTTIFSSTPAIDQLGAKQVNQFDIGSRDSSLAVGAQSSDTAANELSRLDVMPSREFGSFLDGTSKYNNHKNYRKSTQPKQRSLFEGIVDSGNGAFDASLLAGNSGVDFKLGSDTGNMDSRLGLAKTSQRRSDDDDAYIDNNRRVSRKRQQQRPRANRRRQQKLTPSSDRGRYNSQRRAHEDQAAIRGAKPATYGRANVQRRSKQFATSRNLNRAPQYKQQNINELYNDEPIMRRQYDEVAPKPRGLSAEVARERRRQQKEEDDFFKDEEVDKRSDDEVDDDDRDDIDDDQAERGGSIGLRTARSGPRPSSSLYPASRSRTANKNQDSATRSVDDDDEDSDATAIDLRRIDSIKEPEMIQGYNNNNNQYNLGSSAQYDGNKQQPIQSDQTDISLAAAAYESQAESPVQQVDLQTAAGHHHKDHHSHYYQHVEVPKKKAWKFGFKRGNHKHEIERHEKGHKHKFHSSFKWHAKEKCKKKKKCKSVGKMTWHYEHAKKHHHG